jgi:hypothetical protein
MPGFDDDKAKSTRPGQGYYSCNARKNRIFHEHPAQLGWRYAQSSKYSSCLGGSSTAADKVIFGRIDGDQPVNTKHGSFLETPNYVEIDVNDINISNFLIFFKKLKEFEN